MLIPRPELALLERALDDVIADGNGTTIFVTGEPGIGKSTLLATFLDGCDRHHDRNILTATGRCIDIDGISRGYLPWKEVLIELDADRAAGRDAEKKKSFTTIIKTLFDESGSEWIQNIPYVGDISAAILTTAQAIQRIEEIDTKSGETRELSFRERLAHVVKECTGSWMGAIPVVGGLAEAIYKTSRSLNQRKQGGATRSQEDFFVLVMMRLRALARDNPVVVFLDDLQWADASSLSLLLYLARNVHDLPYPLLLIGSYRAEDVRRGRRSPHTDDFERHPLEEKINVLMRYDACQEIALGAFDRSQVGAYVRQRFPRCDFDARFIGELHHVSGGNALFVQEMLTNMIERGIIAERTGVWGLTTQPEYNRLPRTVEGVIRERYERLAEELREMLQVAAVEGEEFSFEVLESILQEDRLALNRRLDRLMNRHELVHRSDRLSDSIMRLYEFTHNLVQKYIYYSMEEDFRREVHRMIAAALKKLLSEEGVIRWSEAYSLHLGVGEGIIDERRRIRIKQAPTAPGTIAVMLEYLRLQQSLVEQHLAEHNNEEAIAVCDHIISLMKVNGDDVAAILQYSRRKAKTLELIGRWSDAEELYREQLMMVREAGDRVAEARLLTSISDLVRRLGRMDEAEQIALDGERIARELGDREAIARSVGYRGLLHWRRGQLGEALTCYAEQEKLARELGNRSALGMALGNRGSVYADRGEYDAALADYAESEEIVRELGDRLGIANSVGNRGTIYQSLGDYDKAMECYLEEEKIEREMGFRKGIGHAVGNRASIHRDRKEYAEALACFREATEVHREIGFLYKMTSWICGTADVLLEIAETLAELPSYLPDYVPELRRDLENQRPDWRALTLAQARRHAQQSLAIADQIGKRSTRFRSRRLLARISAAEGSKADALSALQTLLTETGDVDDASTRDDERADIHYWLWKLGATDKDHRAEAAALYATLLGHIPDGEYRTRIEELRRC